ncbi:hypothetical protein SISSUDRAFT_1036777 [Sistotremastrum suecicum HHB10207 ss-3]|uniref:Uncharacterized protein n=1 Tax=Sistotremastrum suecicum HHB10207 ss-3 TaxID=1314776 RepID=A0A165Z0U9_9AGAM|nr:hypothetical protein SISSUDRAFT_1036777 [Sistotremastrum suecicum HHB10207 ss-3]
MPTGTVIRPIALDHSALSTLEFSAFIPNIFDIFERALPASTQDIVHALEFEFSDKALNLLEVRGWLKGRHGHALRVTDLEAIMDIIENFVFPVQGLKPNHIFAVFRLVAHCLDPTPNHITKDHVWMPSNPNSSFWRSHTRVANTPPAECVGPMESTVLPPSNIHIPTHPETPVDPSRDSRPLPTDFIAENRWLFRNDPYSDSWAAEGSGHRSLEPSSPNPDPYGLNDLAAQLFGEDLTYVVVGMPDIKILRCLVFRRPLSKTGPSATTLALNFLQGQMDIKDPIAARDLQNVRIDVS